MSAFDKVMEVVFNQEYDVLVEKARDAAEALKPYLESEYDGDWFYPLLFLVSSVIEADGVISREEKQFLLDVFERDAPALCLFAADLDTDTRRAAEVILTYMPRPYKHHALFFVAAFATVDGRVCNEEARLIRLLLN